MSIFKRGAVWWIRFTDPNGREIRESAQTTERRQAQEYHDRRKADCWRQMKLGEAPRYTWQQAVVRWIEDHPERKGLANVQLHLRQAHPFLGHLSLNEVTAETVTSYVRDRRVSGVMNSTINQGLSAIRAVLHAAHQWGWLTAVPALQNLPVGERRIRWLTREEADRLVAELPAHLAAMARFSLATGLRETNVCRLEWKQVDVERRVAWIYGDQAKSGKSITLPLNAEAVCVLREQQGQHSRWVFPYAGRAVRKARGTAWTAALQRAGIENFRWHDLRHTWASWHVQAGTPLPVLKELGGWASLDMVLRYAHLGADHLAEHAERISRPRLVRTNPDTTLEKTTATG